jgi:transcriptional regulator with XRE-family HTH domain
MVYNKCKIQSKGGFTMLLSEFVKHKRIEKGLTLSSLARDINVTPMFLSKIENNKTVPKSGDTLESLAYFFKVPFEVLQKMALESIEILRIQNSRNKDIGKYQLSLARAMVTTDLSEEQLLEIEKIIKKET